MARLFVHVEGETEERFVNQVLRDHLVARGFERVDARLLGNARQHTFRRPFSTTWPEMLIGADLSRSS